MILSPSDDASRDADVLRGHHPDHSNITWELTVPKSAADAPSGFTELVVRDAQREISRDGFHSELIAEGEQVSVFWGASTRAPQRLIIRVLAGTRHVTVVTGQQSREVEILPLQRHPRVCIGVLLLDETEPNPERLVFYVDGKRRTQLIRTVPRHPGWT